ncbi:MAG: hypothetical protein A3K03_09095 [Bdellovibrionales bacterium RIFOXYD1_FULL_44_7]|nr:MAG: hypothetical protein A3K03_09095 [Bdellovibrionales bacterium RIFOXYD1_FULL_44_7]
MRAIATNKKRERERLRRPIHIKRVHAELKIAEKEPGKNLSATVRVFLNDFSPKGIGVLSSAKLNIGQEVSLTLDQPTQIAIRGKIVWCQEYKPDSHIMSAVGFSHRAGVEFTPSSPEEKQKLKEYYDELTKHYLYGNSDNSNSNAA